MNAPVLAYFSPSPMEMLIVAGVVLLLFGNRLPGAMRSLGKSFVEFKKGVKGIETDESTTNADEPAQPTADESSKSEAT